MENKIIYFVTVFYVDGKEYNYRPYKRIRCWGWFGKEEDAEKCIMENWTDIYEIGYYNMALIEPCRQGPTGMSAAIKRQRWFDVKYLSNSKYAIREIDTPKKFRNTIGWSYA